MSADPDLCVWIGGIPEEASIPQFLGALKSQGYKACNKIELKKSRNGSQWTNIELKNKQFVQSAIKNGITFGAPPDQTRLKVEIPGSAKKKRQKKNDEEQEGSGYTETGCTDYNDKNNNNKYKKVFVSGIPLKAKEGQVLGAFKRQGYDAKNRIKLFKSRQKGGNKDSYSTILEFETSVIAQSAVEHGLTFNKPPNMVKLFVRYFKEDNKKKKEKRKNSKSDKRETDGGETKKRKRESDSKRVGFYVTAIVDLSGSMAGSRIKESMEGLKLLFGNLHNDDIVELIGFNSNVKQILEPLSYAKLKDELPTAINKCIKNVGGGTAMWDAINEAIESKKKFLAKNVNNKVTHRKDRILVLTDGEDNHSKIDHKKVISDMAFLGMNHDKNDFVLTVIAVGDAAKDTKIKKLCIPDFCHLVAVDDYWSIAQAMGNAFKQI